MKYKRLSMLLGALMAIAVLMSVALTFAQPLQSAMREDVTIEDHEEREEVMEHMHEEYASMMNNMYHERHNEDVEFDESHGHHGCH